MSITQSELKEVLNYNQKSGLFTWNKTLSARGMNGNIAGSVSKSNGYVEIRINKKLYLAHRLAFLYVNGYMPKQVDHINHVRSDNRIDNLREVTHQENKKNNTKQSNNKSGVTGVCWNKRTNKWVAQISVDGLNKHLGFFISFSDAVDARKNAEVLYGFHKNHGKDI